MDCMCAENISNMNFQTQHLKVRHSLYILEISKKIYSKRRR